MHDPSDPAGGQGVSDSAIGGDVFQIGAARDVSIGAPMPPRPPLPDATSTPAPPGLKNLPRRAAVFVGRDEALQRVEQALSEGPGVITQGPQAAVYGLGGIGKSELALQYALRNADRYHLAWWIDADSPAQIQEGLADLARAIAAAKHSVAARQATAEEAAAWAFAWLAAHLRQRRAGRRYRAGAGPVGWRAYSDHHAACHRLAGAVHTDQSGGPGARMRTSGATPTRRFARRAAGTAPW